jgi:hypothetical protein
MLPIVRFPQIVEEQSAWFDPVFATDEQRKHFREYVTGLIVGNEATVTAINRLFLDHNDQSSLNKFATLAEWDENELNHQRVRMELARLLRRPVSAEAGRLIIDDTLAHHTKCKMDGLAYLWDHCLPNRFLLGKYLTFYPLNEYFSCSKVLNWIPDDNLWFRWLDQTGCGDWLLTAFFCFFRY